MSEEQIVGEGRDDNVDALPAIASNTPSMPRAVRSEDLLRGAREVLIQHGQETYRLRLTKAGKLILNK